MAFFGNRRQSDPEPVERDERSPYPRPSLPQQPIGFETVLGTNSTMEGTLVSNGNVRLDGTFTGTLEISGNILVGETAKINADIEARNISIAGAVRGNVTGNKVQLLRTGRIWGDIKAKALTTEEGAFIDGKITMTGHEANSASMDFDDEPAAADVPANLPEVDIAADPVSEQDPEVMIASAPEAELDSTRSAFVPDQPEQELASEDDSDADDETISGRL